MSVRSRVLRGTVAALVAAVACVGCAHAGRRVTINVARVPVTLVREGEVRPQSTLGGLIVPLANVQIQTSLVEPTEAVYVQEGDSVSKGQVLARLNTADLQAQLQSDLGQAASDRAKITSTTLQSRLTIAQNGNSINSAQATVRQVQQTLATDTLNLQRDQQLKAAATSRNRQLDQQRTLVANDQQAVRSAQVSLQNIVAQVQANGTTTAACKARTIDAGQGATSRARSGTADQLRVQIAKARIVSPIDGVVINRNINPGEYPGHPADLHRRSRSINVYAVLNGRRHESSACESARRCRSSRPTVRRCTAQRRSSPCSTNSRLARRTSSSKPFCRIPAPVSLRDGRHRRRAAVRLARHSIIPRHRVRRRHAVDGADDRQSSAARRRERVPASGGPRANGPRANGAGGRPGARASAEDDRQDDPGHDGRRGRAERDRRGRHAGRAESSSTANSASSTVSRPSRQTGARRAGSARSRSAKPCG